VLLNFMDEIAAFPLPGCREPLSSYSHMVGAVVFAVLASVLLRRGRGDWIRTSSLLIMAFASVLLLILSSAYHLCWPGPTRAFMVRADVSAVFLLIAGSMTPVHAILFQGLSRWLPLILIWIAATAGIVWRMIYYESIPGSVGIWIFLLFGWGSAITAVVLWKKFGWAFVQPALHAGLAYTLGALILLFHGPTLVYGVVGPHELWHIAVLAGLSLHWRFVFQFASGLRPTPVAA
jgi:channel protein (hemolysin III family)